MPDFVCTVARVTTRMGQLVVSGDGVCWGDAEAEAIASISNDETGIVWEPDIKSESKVELVCIEEATPATVLFEPATPFACTGTPKDVIKMGLCEVPHVFLRPNHLYWFVVRPNCKKCEEAAAPYKTETAIKP